MDVGMNMSSAAAMAATSESVAHGKDLDMDEVNRAVGYAWQYEVDSLRRTISFVRANRDEVKAVLELVRSEGHACELPSQQIAWITSLK